MLSIAKLYAGHQQYYTDAVARGLDEYYAGVGELPGRWMGRGAELLSLSGELDCQALDAILDGRDPRTGTRLTEDTPKVIGYDATFCAPKSVSLLYALGPPEIAAEVRAAHEEAVRDALRALEDMTCRVGDIRGALGDGPPVDPQTAGQLGTQLGLVEVANRLRPRERLSAVERRPTAVGAGEAGMSDEHVSVEVRVAGAAAAVLEGGSDEPVGLHDHRSPMTAPPAVRPCAPQSR